MIGGHANKTFKNKGFQGRVVLKHFLWQTIGMKRLLISLATITALVVLPTGCGLFSSNDGEIETLRSEVAILTEEIVDLKSDVAALESSPAAVETTTTTTTTSEAPSESVTTPPENLEDEVVDEEAILLATYAWGPSDETVALQEVLGITADGWYGGGTQAAHIAELEARGLSTDNVPTAPPTTTTTTEAPTESTTTAPPTTTTAAE